MGFVKKFNLRRRYAKHGFLWEIAQAHRAIMLRLIRWFYLSIRCALHPESGTILWLGIAVRISRTGEGLLLLRPYFRISTVRPLALKADCYITLTPWAGRGMLAVPALTKSQARLRNGDVSKSSFRRVPSGGATRN